MDRTAVSADAAVASFRAALQNPAGNRSISEFLPAKDSPGYDVVLRALLLAEIAEYAADAGRLEARLAEFPDVLSAAWVADLPVAEFHARKARGERVQIGEYRDRFPELFDAIQQSVSNGQPESAGSLAVLQSGDVVDDFEIVRLIDRGSHGQVYLARQRSLGRLLALKISPEIGHEGQTLARLNHPNIVAVHSETTDAGRKLLALQFVDGHSLKDWIAYRRAEGFHWQEDALASWLNGPETPGDLFPRRGFAAAMCRIVLDVADALAHAHRKHVLHLDVKPSNILLARDGSVLITDFHVAAVVANEREQITPVGGTVAYMSPEQLAGMSGSDSEIDERSDVFSLGCVMYELLTGYRPWVMESSGREAADFARARAEAVKGPWSIPRSVPGSTPALNAVVRKCLQPKPQDRYQNANMLAEDLRRWLNLSPPVFSGSVSAAERMRLWARRHRSVVGVSAVFAAIIVAAFLASVGAAARNLDRAMELAQGCERALSAGDTKVVATGVGEIRGTMSDQALVTRFLFAARHQEIERRLALLATRLADMEIVSFDRLLLDARVSGLDGTQPKPDANPLALFGVTTNDQWETQGRFSELSAEQQRRVAEDVTELILTMLDRLPADHGAAQILAARIPSRHRDLPLVQAVVNGHSKSLPEFAALVTSAYERYLLAVIAASRGEYEFASAQLEEVFETGSETDSRLWAHFLFALCCQQTGRIDEAVESYGICIGRRGDFAWPHYNLGLLYAQQKKVDLAERHMRATLSIDPSFVAALAGLGAVCLLRNDPESALDNLNEAIGAGYKRPEVFRNRAAAREAMGDDQGAQADLRLALELEGDS